MVPFRTRRGRRRATGLRNEGLRRFAQRAGWSVAGPAADLSTAYPVPPLLGAASSQAELTVSGVWAGWSARVSLVRSRRSITRDRRRGPGLEHVVLMTTLETGPLGIQMVGRAVSGGGAEIVPLGDADWPAGLLGRIEGHLASADLQAQDHVVVGEVELSHVRPLDPATALVAEPQDVLALLVNLASLLTVGRGSAHAPHAE